MEFTGIGPAPFCGMMLADMGAEVVRVARPGEKADRFNVMHRGRSAVAIDLKSADGVEQALKLIDHADALIEGFRPGVMERLGLGPEVCAARNPRLVFGRMTGWGQSGPLAQTAGHDINYIALTGALHAIGRATENPPPPLNLIGDFGGGGMMLAFGIVCGILEARQSGRGQVVDAAMTDGAALLMAMTYGMEAAGSWTNRREDNWLDGGSHFYDTYKCADGKWVAVGAIEPQFYALLLEKLGLQVADAKALREVFLTKTRDEWCAIFEGSDACVAPVLDLDEAPKHPHNVARGTFIEIDGVMQPAPAPRFSRTCATLGNKTGPLP